MSQVTAGSCVKIVNAIPNADDALFQSQPILQILSIKKVNTSGSSAQGDRFRIILSDGINFIQAMLATQLNHLVEEENLGRFTLIRLDKFTVNVVQNKRLTILLAITSVGKTDDKIGNPASLDTPPLPQAAENSATAAIVNRQPQAAPVQQVRQTKSNGGDRPPPVYPIENLSPYNNKWTIKARVIQKSEIRHWSNQKGEGKLFSVTLMDETGEIKATAFNTVVDDLFDKIEEGKVYFVSRARVNVAKKKFSNVQNEYELTFEKNTEIEECLDVANVPAIKYNFVELAALQGIEKDAVCDVIAVVKEIGDLGEIVTKTTQKSLAKRELNLVDRSGFSCRLTLWGKQAESFNAIDQPVIAFKGAKVGDFGGRSLSLQSSSTMSINPDITEAHALRGWFDSIGVNERFQSHSSSGGGLTASGSGKGYTMMNLADVKHQELGQHEKADFFSARATTMHIKHENLAYPACPTENCNKKVVEGHDGWRCEKCDKSFPEPEYRYIISMAVADVSDQAWLQGFNDVGTALFGISANELVTLRDTDERKYQQALHRGLGQRFIFECRAKTDSFNDTVRIRYGIMRFHPIDFIKEATDLMDCINSYFN